MNVVLFCHSLLCDWNHGNAHFLRGVVVEHGPVAHVLDRPNHAYTRRLIASIPRSAA